MTLEQFAQRIRGLAVAIPPNADRMVARAAAAVLSTVIPATPVDTGRARGNWTVSIDAPVLRPRDRLDKTGMSTIAEGTAQAALRRPGQTVFICNNVPYIGRLNEGSSAQAPAGFVQMAVRAALGGARGVRIIGG